MYYPDSYYYVLLTNASKSCTQNILIQLTCLNLKKLNGEIMKLHGELRLESVQEYA